MLEAVILRCLAKDPGHRPPSERELNRLLAEVGLEPWTEEAAAQWWDTRVPLLARVEDRAGTG